MEGSFKDPFVREVVQVNEAQGNFNHRGRERRDRSNVIQRKLQSRSEAPSISYLEANAI